MPLSVIDGAEPLQEQYQPAVYELIKYLRSGLGDNLHSVYLYGSVARKTARPGYSNLDVVVVTQRDFEQNRATLLNTVRWRFQSRYPFITDIHIQTAQVKEIASLDSLFSWGFLLRHCAICIYGQNLAECFGDYEPSWEIAKYWNMDIADRLAWYREKIAKAQSEAEQITAQQLVAKKLLRAAYSVVMYRDKNWYDDPRECGDAFLLYHPEKQVEISRLGLLLRNKVIPKRSVIGLLDSFGHWLVEEYKKTEFKIG